MFYGNESPIFTKANNLRCTPVHRMKKSPDFEREPLFVDSLSFRGPTPTHMSLFALRKSFSAFRLVGCRSAQLQVRLASRTNRHVYFEQHLNHFCLAAFHIFFFFLSPLPVEIMCNSLTMSAFLKDARVYSHASRFCLVVDPRSRRTVSPVSSDCLTSQKKKLQ